MSNINELAILITKKIESELMRQFFHNKETPSFFHIRKTILNTLEGCMGELSVTLRSDLELDDHMDISVRESIVNAKLRAATFKVVEGIIDQPEFFEKIVYKDEYSPLENTRRSIIVVKTANLLKQNAAKIEGE